MDHSGMDHGHGDGGDMNMCSMNVSSSHPHSYSYIYTHTHNPSPTARQFQSKLTTPPLSLKKMLFTWSTQNLCIVFPSWRVTGPLSLLVSLLAVVALTAGYEAIREVSRRYEEKLAREMEGAPRKFSRTTLPLPLPP